MKTIKEMYSSSEEYNPIFFDKYERFPSYLSRNNKLEPVLSEYLFNNGFRPVYKDNKKYAICLSHDIDFLYEIKTTRGFTNLLFNSIKKADVKKSIYNFKNIFSRQLNPDWSLNKIIDLENEHNIKSSYFFLALENNEEDYNYPINSLTAYYTKIKDAGSEIGLHGGHKAYNSREKLEIEKNSLEKACGEKITGYRNHYLRFKTPKTWEHLQSLGFIYDTTFGYADLIGYRNGMCYPFRPYDPVTDAYIDILEIPLIVMDVTFWKYMGLNVDQSFTLFKKIANDVKNINGVLTIEWHNYTMTGEAGRLYHKIMDYIVKDEEAWFTNSLDLALLWKEKNLPLMEEMVNANFSKII